MNMAISLWNESNIGGDLRFQLHQGSVDLTNVPGPGDVVLDKFYSGQEQIFCRCGCVNDTLERNSRVLHRNHASKC